MAAPAAAARLGAVSLVAAAARPTSAPPRLTGPTRSGTGCWWPAVGAAAALRTRERETGAEAGAGTPTRPAAPASLPMTPGPRWAAAAAGGPAPPRGRAWAVTAAR